MSTLDYIEMFVLVAIILFVSWFSGKNTQSSSAFLSANKKLGKLQTGFSMAATDFGGSGLVGTIGYCYLVGLGGAWWNLSAAPAFLLVGLFLASKLNQLNGATVPDYLGNRYCPAMKYFSAGMHICTNIAMLSTQFTISSAVLQTVTGFDPKISLLISVLLVVFLTSGGLKAVVNTDVTLFIIIAASVIFCIPVIFSAAGGASEIVRRLPEGFLDLGSIGFFTPLGWFVMCILSYSTNQNYVQRMVAAKDMGTARFAMIFTAFFSLIISLTLGIIGVSAACLLPGIEDTNLVFPSLIMRYFPRGFVGLSIAGVFAATISTGTSLLHAVTILFTNDIWKPIFGVGKSDHYELIFSRLTVIVATGFSMGISLFFTSIISIIYTAGLFYSIAVFAPLTMGISSKTTTAKAAVVSSICAVIVGLFWEFFIVPSTLLFHWVPSNIIGLAVSFIVIAVISASENKKEQV